MDLAPWHTLPKGYSARYVPRADGVYWHLSYGGEHINGGLAEDHEHAQDEASRRARLHKDAIWHEPETDLLDIDLAMDYAHRRRQHERHP
jgi:hypothetical protein